MVVRWIGPKLTIVYTGWLLGIVFLFYDLRYFSRQRYVLGDDAMHKLGDANVAIVGLGGLGLEIGTVP